MQWKALEERCQNWREEFDKDFKVLTNQKYSPIYGNWGRFLAPLQLQSPLNFYIRKNARLHHTGTIERLLPLDLMLRRRLDSLYLHRYFLEIVSNKSFKTNIFSIKLCILELS